MKNLLLLGDSIRMNYQNKVTELLDGRANVYKPAENGRWAGYTLNSLRFWLPEMAKPDVVHWNNGCWDLGDDYGLGRPFSLPEEYESCLERIVLVLRKLCAENVKIVMATTTPFKYGDAAGMIKYNQIIRKVADKYGLEVNDLFALIDSDREKYIGADNVHLSQAGIDAAASQVVTSIEKYLD